MTKLSVNVNKVATLRNARGENNPDLVEIALLIEKFGAHGITVHPRPDQRHIKFDDVFMLKKNLTCELNVEGYPSERFIGLMHEVKPTQITLVPDPPEVLTSNAGFRLKDDFDFVCDVVEKLKSVGSRISLFIDPRDFLTRDVSIIKKTGCDRIELYTDRYAKNINDEIVLSEYQKVAQQCHALGLKINAGHDLSLNNLLFFLKKIPVVEEVSIGHALICDALILGLEETMKRYLSLVK